MSASATPQPHTNPQTDSTLLLFAADGAQAHFMHDDHRFPVTDLELRLDNALALKVRYQVIIESILTALQQDEAVCLVYHSSNGPQVIYGAATLYTSQPAAGDLEVYWRGELMLAFAVETAPPANLTAHQALELLMPYLAALRILRNNNGLVVIDHTQLLSHQAFRWTLYHARTRQVLYRSKPRSYSEMTNDMALITGRLPLFSETADHLTYQITACAPGMRHVLCKDITAKVRTEEIILQLNNIRKNGTSPFLRLSIATDTEEMPFPAQAFHQKLTVLFPSWVAGLNHAAYRQHISEAVQSATPAHRTSTVEFATLNELETLLPLYRQWLEDIRLTNQPGPDHPLDHAAAFHVLKFIVGRQL